MANEYQVATTWLDVWERAAASPAAARADTLACSVEPGAGDALTLGARAALLLDLRAALFGMRMRSTATCPACQQRCEWDCELDALRTESAHAAPASTFEIDADGWRIRARAVTSADLTAIAQCADESGALRALLRRCVLEVRHGEREVDPADLPDVCVETLSATLAAADPQAATSVALVCPACAHAWSADFDIGAYLWTELDGWAQRTLADVHELACRYGWNEAEILALPPTRRARYLAMAAV